MSDSISLFSYIIYENLDEFSQWRLTVSNFRGKEYLSIRKYFLTYEGTWEPTKEGISIELSLVFTYNLLLGLSTLISESEANLAEPHIVEALKISKKQYCEEIINKLKGLNNEPV